MANSKDVVVTGVSTGIGWGTTKVLISKGFRVFGSVRKQADADRLQREFGNVFVALMMDVTDAERLLEPLSFCLQAGHFPTFLQNSHFSRAVPSPAV